MKEKKQFKVYIRSWTLEGDAGENKCCTGNGDSVQFIDWKYWTVNPDSKEFIKCENCWEYVGSTYAVSEKQAISQVCFREKIDRYEHSAGDRYVWFNELKAVEN